MKSPREYSTRQDHFVTVWAAPVFGTNDTERFQFHKYRYNLETHLFQFSDDRMKDIRMACGMEQLWEASFYKNAIEEMLECRQFLQFSFALLFYLEPDSQAEIFKPT
ncbi:E3 ubiquitin-protein ligase dbl4 [Orchesella cincta]|uniref:E3 ubiquitin-protein ligase dbl4 n=1 Tax=Orchesella cincta TaxID=48709 RepID=A0A1D2M5S7_ORCCI|nr:E3 ubiquitin-protein ligase dbl4 [Orchesella cincta]